MIPIESIIFLSNIAVHFSRIKIIKYVTTIKHKKMLPMSLSTEFNLTFLSDKNRINCRMKKTMQFILQFFTLIVACFGSPLGNIQVSDKNAEHSRGFFSEHNEKIICIGNGYIYETISQDRFHYNRFFI